MALGFNCGTFDPYIVAKANSLCDQLGMDTISTGGVIAFVLECYQRGILTKEDTNGLDLDWNNDEAKLELIKRIAFRKGIGNTLAEGTKRAAERIGKKSVKYAMQVKGLEIPALDPRNSTRQGINFSTTSGARHEVGNTKEEQFSSVLVDSLVLCFHIFPWLSYHKRMPFYAQLLAHITNWDINSEELFTIGERIWNLQRCFNVREGIRRRDDRLPERFYTEPLPSGSAKGRLVNRAKFEEALTNYYVARGWNPENGIPRKDKLKELGLIKVVKELIDLQIEI
jgi:aldehyde:ferredoxin oxidoreductase